MRMRQAPTRIGARSRREIAISLERRPPQAPLEAQGRDMSVRLVLPRRALESRSCDGTLCLAPSCACESTLAPCHGAVAYRSPHRRVFRCKPSTEPMRAEPSRRLLRA